MKHNGAYYKALLYKKPEEFEEKDEPESVDGVFLRVHRRDGDPEDEHWYVSLDDWQRHIEPRCAPLTRQEKIDRLLRTREFKKAAGDDDGSDEYRWITVHPHGDDEKGQPVKIRRLKDGGWGVIGGAGGKLNGLRIEHVKSQAEYKRLAKEKAEARKAKQQEKLAAHKENLIQAQRRAIRQENAQTGRQMSNDAVEEEAIRRVGDQWEGSKQNREAAIKQGKQTKREKESALIERVAQAQGWDAADYQLSDEAIEGVRERKLSEVLQENPELKRAAYDEDVDPKVAERAQQKIEKQVDGLVNRVVDKHHSLVLKRAREAQKNHNENLVTATDEIATDALGGIEVGDIVHDTLGDSGTGYVAHIDDLAAQNGIDTANAASVAQSVNWDSSLERHEGDLEATARGQEAIERMQAGAKRSRDEVARAMEQLGEGEDSPLARISHLNTTPATSDAAESAKVLSETKILETGIKSVDKELRELRNDVTLERLPNAAVLTGAEEISEEEAMKLVRQSVADTSREHAMDGLMQLYNVQTEENKLTSHINSGRNSFLNNVANTVGVRAPDPYIVDTIGEHAAARLMARAITAQVGDKEAKRIAQALAQKHIDNQEEIANTARQNAENKFKEANSIDVNPLTDVDSMLTEIDKQGEALELRKQGREILGLALGQLQAAAALNEALDRVGTKGADEPITVSLGDISTGDAVRRAAALGLKNITQKDPISGEVVKQGDYELYNDGVNKILTIHPSGQESISDFLMESPEHLEHRERGRVIKEGGADEVGWLPVGFSDRPASSVSRPQHPQVEKLECQLDLSGIKKGKTPLEKADMKEALQDRIKRHVAQRIEAGHTPTQIRHDLLTYNFRLAHVPKSLTNAYLSVTSEMFPEPKQVAGVKKTGEDYTKWDKELHDKMHQWHSQFIAEEAEKMGFSSSDGQDFVSLHSQTLPQSRATVDLIHQVNIADPRLRLAFKGEQDLTRSERKMIRDYAYDNILTGDNGEILDRKDKENPIEPLSHHESEAFDKWNDLRAKGDPYESIQQMMVDRAESGGGGGLGFSMEPNYHPFAKVNLNNPDEVYQAALNAPDTLGLAKIPYGLDPKTGQHSEMLIEGLTGRVHHNEETGEDTIDKFSDEQRDRAKDKAVKKVKKYLRQHAIRELWGFRDGIKEGFDPDNVNTAANRWAEYVRDIGGLRRAYSAITDHMKGDFVSRFASAYKERTGHDIRQAYVPVAHSDAHAEASLSATARKEKGRLKRSEQAKMQNRKGGRFAEGSVIEAMEAKERQEQSGGALFDFDTGQKPIEERGTHRVTIGRAAEAMIGNMVPNLGLHKGVSAISDLDMSSGENIKRQRAIKLVEAQKRLALTLGTGTGKTSVALGALSELRAKGKAKRAIMAVPSAVVQQFGGEAAAFYDPTRKDFPKWFSDSSATADQRRAAYHEDSGNDICVVTHQALRDDLTWALAKQQFGGDRKTAARWLANAPEEERNQAIKDAVKAEGWNFDMSVVDEGQALLNRQGKENSAMANAIDALTHDKEYHITMSADIIKNDASEAFDALRKVAPQRYVNDDNPAANKQKRGVITRSEFMRRYSVNTPAAHEALAREVEPYHYAESIKPKLSHAERTHVVPMTEPQKEAYKKVLSMYRRARHARVSGDVDVEAMRYLSPSSFEGLDAQQSKQRAAELQRNAGLLKEPALKRVVHLHPEGAKMRWLDHRLGLESHPEYDEMGIDPIPVDGHPKIIFAHNLDAVNAIQKHLEDKGIRVATLTGKMRGADKDNAKLGFSPAWDSKAQHYLVDPSSDIIICSDAGRAGWNGQRADHTISWDTSDTAMTMKQREGRAYRTGQRADVVYADTVMTDSPIERKARKRLENKMGLRDTLTAPANTIDDSGLGAIIKQATNSDVERRVRGIPPVYDDGDDNEEEQFAKALAGNIVRRGYGFVPSKNNPDRYLWRKLKQGQSEPAPAKPKTPSLSIHRQMANQGAMFMGYDAKGTPAYWHPDPEKVVGASKQQLQKPDARVRTRKSRKIEGIENPQRRESTLTMRRDGNAESVRVTDSKMNATEKKRLGVALPKPHWEKEKPVERIAPTGTNLPADDEIKQDASDNTNMLPGTEQASPDTTMYDRIRDWGRGFLDHVRNLRDQLKERRKRSNW